MKDKEKQIEEITNVICESCKGRMDFCFYKKQPCEQVIEDAKALYEQGYRKLPEDSIVLTERELLDECELQYNTGKEKGSKETAEKTYKEIRDFFNGLGRNQVLKKETIVSLIEKFAHEKGFEIKE